MNALATARRRRAAASFVNRGGSWDRILIAAILREEQKVGDANGRVYVKILTVMCPSADTKTPLQPATLSEPAWIRRALYSC
jgi:hypothetical protein